MESLHLSFSRVVDAGIFKGIKIDNSVTISHLFYADDAVFIGEWSQDNLNRILNVLHCFHLASGLRINVKKSHLLGVGVPHVTIHLAAANLGCSVMKAPFKYLGVMIGGNTLKTDFWGDIVRKLNSRMSKWKLKTLSIGGRLTLLKSVLGATPIYNMSLFKVPKTVLNLMESIRRDFFYGFHGEAKKIFWVKWSKVLAAKKFGGLGVSSFFALNRALLFKWVWRFISRDNSLWFRFVNAMHGPLTQHSARFSSIWSTIIREVYALKNQGIDLISHCKIRIGDGLLTRFWSDIWVGDNQLRVMFPRIYALELHKDCSVADKMVHSVVHTLHCWRWDMNGSGEFRVKDVRNLLDDFFLPKDDSATRWIKSVPIKINVFAWRASQDRLPSKLNLLRRGVQVDNLMCPICNSVQEDISHVLFTCEVAAAITRLVCRWWDVDRESFSSYMDWLSWFKNIWLGSKIKSLLEGVFYTTWWAL
ncbi:RNA-directed DNA polymerase, eukaryota [Tanacetum coccineum]